MRLQLQNYLLNLLISGMGRWGDAAINGSFYDGMLFTE
jgi:hypothetical protein